MAFLLIVGGPNEGDFHPLQKEPVSVGRDEGCTIQILDEAVSRRHLKVRFEAAAWMAADDESANGVFINGQKIAMEVPLSDGDLIKIGDSELLFSERDFIDSKSALEHYGRRTEHDVRTIIQ